MSKIIISLWLGLLATLDVTAAQSYRLAQEFGSNNQKYRSAFIFAGRLYSSEGHTLRIAETANGLPVIRKRHFPASVELDWSGNTLAVTAGKQITLYRLDSSGERELATLRHEAPDVVALQGQRLVVRTGRYAGTSQVTTYLLQNDGLKEEHRFSFSTRGLASLAVDSDGRYLMFREQSGLAAPASRVSFIVFDTETAQVFNITPAKTYHRVGEGIFASFNGATTNYEFSKLGPNGFQYLYAHQFDSLVFHDFYNGLYTLNEQTRKLCKATVKLEGLSTACLSSKSPGTLFDATFIDGPGINLFLQRQLLSSDFSALAPVAELPEYYSFAAMAGEQIAVMVRDTSNANHAIRLLNPLDGKASLFQEGGNLHELQLVKANGQYLTALRLHTNQSSPHPVSLVKLALQNEFPQINTILTSFNSFEVPDYSADFPQLFTDGETYGHFSRKIAWDAQSELYLWVNKRRFSFVKEQQQYQLPIAEAPTHFHFFPDGLLIKYKQKPALWLRLLPDETLQITEIPNTTAFVVAGEMMYSIVDQAIEVYRISGAELKLTASYKDTDCLRQTDGRLSLVNDQLFVSVTETDSNTAVVKNKICIYQVSEQNIRYVSTIESPSIGHSAQVSAAGERLLVKFDNDGTVYLYERSRKPEFPTAAVLDEDAGVVNLFTVTDADQDLRSVEIVTAAKHGTASVDNFKLSYQPTANFNGQDSLQLRATDLAGNIVEKTVNIMVRPVNDLPVASDQQIIVSAGQTYQGKLIATDVDGDPLTFSAVSSPVQSTLSISPDGTFVLNPVALANGSDQFVFKVRDSASSEGQAIVKISYASKPETPSAEQKQSGGAVGGFLVGLFLLAGLRCQSTAKRQ